MGTEAEAGGLVEIGVVAVGLEAVMEAMMEEETEADIVVAEVEIEVG